jgi:glucan phosphoethanolaminetransferase (alkaline phosphatase superfamily)
MRGFSAPLSRSKKKSCGFSRSNAARCTRLSWNGGQSVAQAHPQSTSSLRGREDMFLAIAIVLAVIWLILFLALHVTSFFIHILIILAVISLIAHLFTGKKS